MLSRERDLDVAKFDSLLWSLASLIGINKEQYRAKTEHLEKLRRRYLGFLYQTAYEPKFIAELEQKSIDEKQLLQQVAALGKLEK